MTEFTSRPKAPKLVANTVINGLAFIVMDFENRGDFCAFRGPAQGQDLSDDEEIYSVNVCDKPYTAIHGHGEADDFISTSKPAFYNTNYAKRNSTGPFYVIAQFPNTRYFCVKSEKVFEPLNHEFITVDGSFITDPYIGSCVAVLEGVFAGHGPGELIYLKTTMTVHASGRFCIASVKTLPTQQETSNGQAER